MLRKNELIAKAKSEYEAAIAEAKRQLDARLEVIAWLDDESAANGEVVKPNGTPEPTVVHRDRELEQAVQTGSPAAVTRFFVDRQTGEFSQSDIVAAVTHALPSASRDAVAVTLKRLVASKELHRVRKGNSQVSPTFEKAEAFQMNQSN